MTFDASPLRGTPYAITIVVTACREAATVGRAIAALLAQPLPVSYELLVVCPDAETAAAATATGCAGLRVLHDEGRGKPAALNLALQEAQGEIVVLTDGDVWVAPGAVTRLLAAFDDPRVGIATGRPVSLSPRTTMLGYWSHLLTEAGAHRERLRRDAQDGFLVCSGYLYALRRALWRPLPEEALAEDAVVSGEVWDQGYLTRYVPAAQVYVRYPATYRDWVAQKVRSTGGYVQPFTATATQMRSLRREVLSGFWAALTYPRSPREFIWTLALFAARLHVWTRILLDVRLRQRSRQDLWSRIETTK